MTKPTCTGTTKTGQPCKANPRQDTGLCNAHSPKKVQESSGFGGSQSGAGRPKLLRPSQVAQRLIEANELALQRPYWRTLGYDVKLTDDGPVLVEIEGGGAKLFGTSKDGEVCLSSYEDLDAMQRAAERLQDRVYGRPKQQTEITGGDGGPLEIVTPVTRPGVVGVKDLIGKVLPVVAVNGNGNGHASLN